MTCSGKEGGGPVSTDDDRIAFLAGEEGVRLPPDDERQLEGLRELLRDPATWAEPDPALEDRVVAAIVAEAAGDGPAAPRQPLRPPNRRRRLAAAVLTGAAAAAVAAGLAITTVTR